MQQKHQVHIFQSYIGEFDLLLVMGRRYHCYGRVDWYPAGAATAAQPAYPT